MSEKDDIGVSESDQYLLIEVIISAGLSVFSTGLLVFLYASKSKSRS